MDMTELLSNPYVVMALPVIGVILAVRVTRIEVASIKAKAWFK